MKKIKYKGSLTNDLDLINDRNQPEETVYSFNAVIRVIWIVLIAIIVVLSFAGRFNPALISSLFSSITAITLTSSVNRNRRLSNRFEKMNRKTQLHSLLYEMAKEQKELNAEDIYKIDDIIEAVVVEHSPENTNEGVTTEDLDNYIREVTSDIYMVNKAAKLKVLREIKSVMSIAGSKRPITGAATLYELEEDEIPKKEELPVKQVLRLRNDNNEKYTL